MNELDIASLIAEAAEALYAEGFDGPYVAYTSRRLIWGDPPQSGLVKISSSIGDVRIQYDPGMPADKILVTTTHYFGHVSAIVVGTFDD